MKREKGCPLCGNVENSLIYEKKQEGLSWIQCKECSLVYKTAGKDSLSTDTGYYREGQMRETVPYRYGDSSSVTPEIAFEEKNEIQWGRFLKVKEYINKDSSVMEIGCGAGGFLHIVKPFVQGCVGVELDKELVEFSRSKLSLDVRDTLLSEIDFSGKKFDLICMFHVLEHFDDPKSFLHQVKEHLKPGGRLVIEVPNFNDTLLQVFGLKKYQEIYFTVHHELYFSQKSLSKLLEDCGFQCTFSPFNEYGIANHLNWVQNDRPVPGSSRQSGRCFQVSSYNKNEKNSEFVGELNQWLRQINDDYKELLASYGFFDTLFCIAQKS